MQQRQIIHCDDGTSQAQWICIKHQTFICEYCRKVHENCKVLTIDEFPQKFSELLKYRSQQIEEVQKLQDKMDCLLKSPQRQTVQEMLKLMENFNYNEIAQNALMKNISQSFQEFKQQKTKEKLKGMLRYMEFKDGNIILQNDFTDYYQQLKQKLTEYMDQIQNIFNGIKQIIEQQQDDDDTESDSSSLDCNEKMQIDETQIKLPQNIINYETAYNFLVRQDDQERDPTSTYLEEYQEIKFLLEIRDNYVIAASNFKIFLIQLQPPVVKSMYTFDKDKITSISKFQNQDQYKFIIAQKNGEINIFNTNNDSIQFLKNIIVFDERGRLLIGLSENVLVTVGGNKKIRYYYPDQGKFDGTRIVEGRNFIRKPPKCLLVLNDNINFIVVAGAQDLFIIRNQVELENLHTVDQKSKVRFLGYLEKNFENENEKKKFLFAATHNKVYIYDITLHIHRIFISFPYKISYFQVINNKCLVNCRVEAEVNGFRAYRISIGEVLENMQRQDLENVRNRNIKLSKFQDINQRLVLQIFIVDNAIVRRESINI